MFKKKERVRLGALWHSCSALAAGRSAEARQPLLFVLSAVFNCGSNGATLRYRSQQHLSSI